MDLYNPNWCCSRINHIWIFVLLLCYASEKAMATHSSTLAWKIPLTKGPGRLQSMWSRRVGHNWATSFSLSTFMHWRRKWQPTPVFLPGESQGQGSLVGCYGVTQSQTRLKQLSNSSSRLVIAFFPRSKYLLISWLQSPSAVILEAPEKKSVTVSTISPTICHEVMDQMPWSSCFEFWVLSSIFTLLFYPHQEAL